MAFEEHEVYALYETLWRDAYPAIARNEVTVDPYLSNREQDTRRGLTVLARVSEDTCDEITRFVRELKQLEPEQYYPQPDEYHVTVLSLFAVSEDHHACLEQKEAYCRAVRTALRDAPDFTIAFSGVTATTGVIMVQGFPQGGTLNNLRESLRSALRDAGLGQSLDTRYRIRAAHASVARFAAPLRDPLRTSELLLSHRETDFGVTRVQRLETVANDWYIARNNVTLLDTHPLSKG